MSFIAFLTPPLLTHEHKRKKKITKYMHGSPREEGGEWEEWRNRRLLFEWRPGKVSE